MQPEQEPSVKIMRKKSYLFIILLVAGLGLAAPGFSVTADDAATVQDIERETTELLQALKAYSIEQRDEALEHSSTALDNLDQRIEALETQMLDQWDDMDQAARATGRASLQALREQRTRVAEWFGSLKISSASAWGHIKQGFSEAYQDLQGAWENSEQEINREERK
jgi:hypothetical protein